MIEVKWDIENSDQSREAQGAVEKVVRRLQPVWGATVCPIHCRPPVLRVRGQGVPSLKIELETCCQVLREQFTQRIQNLRSGQRTSTSAGRISSPHLVERRSRH